MARPSTSIEEHGVCGVITVYPIAAISGLPKPIGETEFCNSNDTVASVREGFATSVVGDTDVLLGQNLWRAELSIPVAGKAQAGTGQWLLLLGTASPKPS